MLVLAGDVVVGQEAGELLHKLDYLLMPGHVGHGQIAGGALAAVGYTLKWKRRTVYNWSQKKKATEEKCHSVHMLICERSI